MVEIDRVGLSGEAEDLVDSLGQHLLVLESRGVSGELLGKCLRVVHTLKGLAGAAGQLQIAELAHSVEALFERLGEDPGRSAAALDLFHESAELFSRGLVGPPERTPSAEIVDDLCSRIYASVGPALGPGGRREVVIGDVDTRVLDQLNRHERRHLEEALRADKPVMRMHLLWDPETVHAKIEELKRALEPLGEIIAFVPGPDPGDKLRLDVVIASRAATAALARCAAAICFEVIGVESASGASPGPDTGKVRSESQTVRVDIRKIDALLGAVGELSLLVPSVAGAVEAMRDAGLEFSAEDLGRDLERLEMRIGELQRGLLGFRMVALGPLLARLGRLSRRIAKATVKRVRFEVEGASTEVDKAVVEEISEPLLHLLRNAIDHGIEPAVERVRAGKPVDGMVSIRAHQEGQHLIVEVADDGRGVDRPAVIDMAVSSGLTSPGASASLTDTEVFEFLFAPGFSTRREANLVSGRGVGLDAVHAAIGSLGGVIAVSSEAGVGTTFTIRVPITLALVHALLVRVAGQLFAMPVSGVVESARIDRADVVAGGRLEVWFRGARLPVSRVADVFELSAGGPAAPETVVVSGVGSSRFGLLVDAVEGTQDVLVKPLPRSLPPIRGLSGAAQLGGGTTVLVLDVPSLLVSVARGQP